jgi:hypothetical protein
MADRVHTLARLTPRMLAQSRVIAKGNRIRDVQGIGRVAVKRQRVHAL